VDNAEVCLFVKDHKGALGQQFTGRQLQRYHLQICVWEFQQEPALRLVVCVCAIRMSLRHGTHMLAAGLQGRGTRRPS
jgi:hypothetical protein